MKYSQFKRGIAFAISLLLCAQPVMAEPVEQRDKAADVETVRYDTGVTFNEDVTDIGEVKTAAEKKQTEEWKTPVADMDSMQDGWGTVSMLDEDGNVIETEEGYLEFDTFDLMDNTSGIMAISNVSDFSVPLKGNGSSLWIDRIDIPDYAVNVYNQLAESEFWTNDANFSGESGHTENIGTLNGKYVVLRVGTKDSADETKKNIWAALDAFDRDHPEIFWCSTYQLSLTVEDENGSGTTFYLYLKSKEGASSEPYDIRKEGYQSGEIISDAITRRDFSISKIKQDENIEPSLSKFEKVQRFNEWLTKHNEYNTIENPYNWPESCRECITALIGKYGEDGPVCEGYARALKVLCDDANIGCTLVDGDAKTRPSSTAEAHMWNYVQLDDGKWYGVDVTWNDPRGGKSGAESGVEGEYYLCVGSQTVINEQTFEVSHPVENKVEKSRTAFTNGPDLSLDKYVPSSSKTKPSISNNDYPIKYTYTGNSITVPQKENFTIDSPGAVTFEWYKGKGTTEWLDSLPKDAGTYTLRVKVAEKDDFAEGHLDVEIVIDKATPHIQTKPIASAITYGQTLNDSELNDGAAQVSENNATSVEGAFSWADKTIKPTVADSNNAEYEVTFTPEDQSNFNIVEKIKLKITVNKADYPTSRPNSTMTVSYTVKTVGEVKLPDDWAWEDGGVELTVGASVEAKAVYKGSDAGKGNYENETIEITITRSPCEHTGGEGTATCVEGKICDICGERYGKPLGHAYGEPEWTWDKTDENKVTVTFTCSRNCMEDGATWTKDVTAGVSEESVDGAVIYTYTATVNPDFSEQEYKTTKQVTVNTPAEEDGEETRLVVQEGITEIPDTLTMAKPELNTKEKIVQAMIQKLPEDYKPEGEGEEDPKPQNTKITDVELQVKSTEKDKWVSVTPENFPKDGLTVTIPYPEGIDQNNLDKYDFVVTHMFTHTSDDGQYKAGDVERPRSTKTPDGLRVTVYSLSPFMVAWKEAVSTPIPSGPSGYDPAPSAPSVTVETGSAINGSFSVSDTNARVGDTVTVTPKADEGYVMDKVVVTDKAGKPIEVRDNGDGTYSFVMPAEDAQPVKVDVTFKEDGTVVPGDATMKFTSEKQLKALQDRASNDGDCALKLEAIDGADIGDLADWTITSDNPDVVKVLKNNKLRYMDLGTANITVVAKDKDGKEYTITFPVSVTELGVPTFTLSHIGNKAAKTFTVTTSTVRGADGFQVKYSLKRSLKSSKHPRFECGKKLNRQTVKTNKSKMTYYVRVRAYKMVDGERVNGGWSKMKSIKSI